MEYFVMLLTGLLNNIFITVVSSIVPVIIGTISYYICDQNNSIIKSSNFCGMIFESFCPITTIMLLYFGVFGRFGFSSFLCCVIGFSISFLGYMPMHYNEEYSFMKNTVVNFLGLISTLFKWSFCISIIGVNNMLRAAQLIYGRTYNSIYYWISFFLSFIVVLIIELTKYIAKEKMQ